MSSSVGEKPWDDAPQGHEKRRGKARCGGVSYSLAMYFASSVKMTPRPYAPASG